MEHEATNSIKLSLHLIVSGVNKWILDTINSSHQSGQVRTITGRIRRLEIGLAVKGFAGRKRYDRGHVERQAVNTCVQGSASDLFKSAVSRIESAGLGIT